MFLLVEPRVQEEEAVRGTLLLDTEPVRDAVPLRRGLVEPRLRVLARVDRRHRPVERAGVVACSVHREVEHRVVRRIRQVRRCSAALGHSLLYRADL